MTEEERAVRIRKNGVVEVFYGLEISTGPETYRLLITYPPAMEGRIEEFSLDSIESVHPVEPGPRSEPPEIVDE